MCQDLYYGGTFNFTRAVNGQHCLIWSRPVDGYPAGIIDVEVRASKRHDRPKVACRNGYHIECRLTLIFRRNTSCSRVGWAIRYVALVLSHRPRRLGGHSSTMQDPDYSGLQDALINMLESAWRNYTNFGSDTGGYRGGTRTVDLFVRWAQLSTFTPLFENGGNNDHTPWSFDAPGSTTVTDIYRSLVAAHYELGPYFIATGSAALCVCVGRNSMTLTCHHPDPLLCSAAGVSSITPTSKVNKCID